MGNTSTQQKQCEEPTNLPTLRYYEANSQSTVTAAKNSNSLYSSSFPSNSPPSFKCIPTTPVSFAQSASFHKARHSLLNVNNGVTDVYISSKICKIAAEFWCKHIDTLSPYYQLEVGCSISCLMISTNKDLVKHILKSNANQPANMKKMSLKFLDMIGWFIRYLSTDSADLLQVLTKLGAMHQSMGIKIAHFNAMLQAMHETFSHYFQSLYSTEIRYAMDEIFALATKVMTGECLLKKINDSTDLPFLHNVDLCLQSSLGREYLFKYLAESCCDEIVLFLRFLCRFKKAVSEKERLVIAREITKTCIDNSATFALSLSYGQRADIMRNMNVLEQLSQRNDILHFVVPTDLFSEAEEEVVKLIWSNHWKQFVEGMKMLQAKACHV